MVSILICPCMSGWELNSGSLPDVGHHGCAGEASFTGRHSSLGSLVFCGKFSWTSLLEPVLNTGVRHVTVLHPG